MEPAVPRPPLTPKLNLSSLEPVGSPLVAARQLTASTDALARAPTAGTPADAAPADSPSVEATASVAPAKVSESHGAPPEAATQELPVVPAAHGHATVAAVADVSAAVLGSKVGKVTGGTVTPGRVGTLKVLSLGHSISTPYDATSGAASGRAQHEPLVAVFAVDSATPVLLSAAASGETFTAVSLELFATSADTAPAFRIDLANAQIVAARLGWGAPGASTAAPSAPTLTASFVYSKIGWTLVEGAKTSAATWSAH